jgi:hypothetical protein
MLRQEVLPTQTVARELVRPELADRKTAFKSRFGPNHQPIGMGRKQADARVLLLQAIETGHTCCSICGQTSLKTERDQTQTARGQAILEEWLGLVKDQVRRRKMRLGKDEDRKCPQCGREASAHFRMVSPLCFPHSAAQAAHRSANTPQTRSANRELPVSKTSIPALVRSN